MSKTAEKYKKWYESGFWKEEMLKTALEKGLITQEEYEEIVNGTE